MKIKLIVFSTGGIWAASDNVGCGTRRCNTLEGPGWTNGLIVVYVILIISVCFASTSAHLHYRMHGHAQVGACINIFGNQVKRV